MYLPSISPQHESLADCHVLSTTGQHDVMHPEQQNEVTREM